MAEDPSKDMFDFMQKMWNPLNFPVPGMLTPTIDIEEIDKQISERRSVENWLKMNLGFLQMTISTLELQKTALETLEASGKDAKGARPFDSKSPKEDQ